MKILVDKESLVSILGLLENSGIKYGDTKTAMQRISEILRNDPKPTITSEQAHNNATEKLADFDKWLETHEVILKVQKKYREKKPTEVNPVEIDGFDCDPEDMSLPTINELNNAITSLKGDLLMQEIAMNEVLDIIMMQEEQHTVTKSLPFPFPSAVYVFKTAAYSSAEALKAKLTGEQK